MESETYDEHMKHKAAAEGAEAAEEASEDETNEDDANASENEAQEETDDASGNETAEPEVPQGPPYMKFLRKRKADIVSGADIAETFALIEAEMKDLAERVTEAKTREALAILAKEQTLEKFTMVAEKNAKAEQVAARQQDLKAQETARKMLKALFPVLDNFDRAAKMIKPKTEGEKSINDSYRKLIEVTVGTFEQMGVEIIGEEIVGTPFNASLHEALASLPTDQFADESVMKVAQKGYVYEGFLLREAQVAVADNEQDREEKQAAMRAEREAQTASD